MNELKKQSMKVPHVDFPASEKNSVLQEIDRGGDHGGKVREALLHLAICHNVIREKNNFTSSSPDEVSLVSFAKYVGYEFNGRNDRNEMEVLECSRGETLRYELLHTLDFSSERKRMSVLVRDLSRPGKPILLLSKGADEIILARLGESKEQQIKKEELVKVLYDYACQGLRTLVLAQKQVDPSYYEEWDKRYCKALTTVGPERNELIEGLQYRLSHSS